MSLGAFMAGVLLSESEYRHELQADIEPFEGLLLGFFFISVGMSADLGLARQQPALIARRVLALLCGQGRPSPSPGSQAGNAQERAALRPRPAAGSEFSFVLFGAAVAGGALASARPPVRHAGHRASMVATPILFAASEAADPAAEPRAAGPAYDTIDAAHAGDHLRLRPVRPDRRPRAAHAGHRVHRAGTRPGPGGGGPALRHKGLFRRSDAA